MGDEISFKKKYGVSLGIYDSRSLLGILDQILFGERFFKSVAWGCDLDNSFAWSLAWGGFAWGCEAGVSLGTKVSLFDS